MGNYYHYGARRLTAEQKQRLETGKPIFFQNGVRITKNKLTGQYEGFPQEWAQQYDLPIKVCLEKLMKTKNLPQQIRPQYDLPESIITLVNSQHQCYEFSPPLDFKHNMHLEVDMAKPFGIKGLPEQWIKKLQMSKIDQKEIKEDPLPAIQMISNFQKEIQQSSIESILLTNDKFQKIVDKVLFIEQNPSNKFIFKKELGKGAVCKVFEAVDRQQKDRKTYACRIIKIKQQQMLQKIKIQIAVMQLCSSPCLEHYYFTYYFKESLFMFVEYVNGGSLTDFIYHYSKKIPQSVMAYLLHQILIGLEALHLKRQLHRDIKSDNILFNTNGEIKIADFGFAIQLTKQRLNRKSIVGTPAWMAPQLIRKEDYDEKVDIWSLGMVAFELIEGQPPYLRLPHLKAMHSIMTKPPPQPKNVSPELLNFVNSCLRLAPNQRSSAKQLLAHIFLSKNQQEGKERFIQMIKQMKSQFPF